ncbi:MAG: YraN family protein [Dehalococcoidales bacterium]|nr:YraN family protein [Dehalococcoidales bacterium]
MKRREAGILGEKLAQEFLRQKGYQIIETNYRCRDGEIDIVARQGEVLVFIEVRSKQSDKFGSPEESVTPAKRAKLRLMADHYLQNHVDLPDSWRIDVVAIEFDNKKTVKRIDIIENAVGEE